MDKLKVMVVIGTRPEAIKMCPIVLELRRNSDSFTTVVCCSGQHSSMCRPIFDLFEVKVDIDFKIMDRVGSIEQLLSSLIQEFSNAMKKVKPDLVLVHGDTSTALAGALAAGYLGLPIAHVEAGLRTYDRSRPFPEELNRQIISRCATYHFAPTKLAVTNLESEGLSKESIQMVGNTVVDSLLIVSEKISTDVRLRNSVMNILEDNLGLNWRKSPFILVTGHRRENIGQGFDNICFALKELAGIYANINFIYPVHLNPKVDSVVRQKLKGSHNVLLPRPLEYPVFVHLLQNAMFVLTDSGGIQEEAPTFEKFVFIMRNETERPEIIESGCAMLVGSDAEKIVHSVSSRIDNCSKNPRLACNPFGKGNSAKIIVENLKRIFC